MATSIALEVEPVLISAITTPGTTVLSVPAGQEFHAVMIRLANLDVVDHVWSLYDFNNVLGSEDNAHKEFPEQTLEAGGVVELGPFNLASLRDISIVADVANKINARAHGFRVS